MSIYLFIYYYEVVIFKIILKSEIYIQKYINLEKK